MKKSNFTAIEMLVVIIVLGIFTVSMLSVTSYAYKDRSEDYYEEIEHVIIKQAELYGKTLTNLESEGNLIVTLNDLIDSGYYIPDGKDGAVVDPRNSKATLNGLKIKLTYIDADYIRAEILEDE